MIIVLCILMFFMVLSFSVLMVSAVVLGTSKKNAVSERCKTAAATFSAMLEEQLIQERETTPLRLQSFFMEMVGEEVKKDPSVTGNFYWDEDTEAEDEAAIHKITVQNGGKDMKNLLNGYDIRVEAVWIGSKESFLEAYDSNAEKPEDKRFPPECCYSGIRLKVTTICENEKFHESYKATVYYNVRIDGEPGKKEAGVWKFTTSGRETS